jgi:hypothetical protein
MSRHVTYRGTTIDMESLRRDNEKTVALGNMKVNARGDHIDRGKITKTAEEIARENHRVQSAITNTGLKGPPPVEDSKPQRTKPSVTTSAKSTKTVEKELPSGDIVIENKDD